ncbi:hypothetical protein MRB53_024815 [Persea americana]|uniref:Uncharacterized protein n=1 Tax=Persea americana TaxID=3435 RepID=A0ACC2LDP3_PERAE|nr:hypothetical protein MRB53_024815 [Persea americana]
MLRQRGRCYAAEDLSAAAFGDIGGEVRDPPQAVAPTPPAFAGGTPASDAETVGTATTGAARPDEAEVVSAPPPAAVMDDSPPGLAVGAGGRARSAEVAEGGRPEKRARVESSPGPSSPPPAGGTILPPPLAPWRPAIEELLQRCQMGIERLDAAEAREAEWVVERDELRASLASKDATLAEVAARNAGLVFDFEESKVEVERLKDELADEKSQNLHLASELDDLRIADEDAIFADYDEAHLKLSELGFADCWNQKR